MKFGLFIGVISAVQVDKHHRPYNHHHFVQSRNHAYSKLNPWERTDFFDREDETMRVHLRRYEEAASGKYKTQQEIHDAERKDHEETLKAHNRIVPTLPADIVGYDENKYATTHRCFGSPCPVDPPKSDKYAMRPTFGSLLQLEQPLGHY